MIDISRVSLRAGRVLCVALLLLAAPGRASEVPVPSPPEISARAWVLLDYHSSRVLVEGNPDEQLETASLSKMMTAYVAFTELTQGRIKLDDMVRISQKAWETTGSRMFVEVDNQVSVENLLKGVIIQSGNDASIALAEHVAGDETVFAGMMNQHAEKLGMTRTRFANATGLPAPEHFSTARDLAILGQALIRDFPDYYTWHSIREFKFNDIVQYNRNRLLWRDASVDGIKTGHTESAGYGLVASATKEDMRLISVVLGSDSEANRAQQSQALLNYGFRFYETHRRYEANSPVASVRVWKGESEMLPIGVSRDVYVTVPRGQYEKLAANVEVDASIVAPVHEGEQRGTVTLMLGDNLLAEQPLIALETVAAGSLWKKMTDNVKLLFQ